MDGIKCFITSKKALTLIENKKYINLHINKKINKYEPLPSISRWEKTKNV